MTMKRAFFLLIIGLLNTTVQAQLKSPSEFLGYDLGDRFTPHHKVVSYFYHVAENSQKVDVEQYGESNEYRPLITAFVSTADNLSNKENIRADNLRRAGLMDGNPSSNVGIVWLSYNIHGNESNSMEASMKTLYALASGESAWNSDQWLRNTLVIIDPVMNPDGRDRYAIWYNQMLGKQFNALPEAREHNEPWPGGRMNHYYFDLNRDWAWQTQVESFHRNELYQKWLPHIHVDLHEQGYNRPYYFAPASQPMHEDITSWQREFQTYIGKNHSKYFDKENWLYFTKEVFDLLYPSYGDTWPTYQGAIGMTYEQAGGGRAGLGIIKQEGDTLTLLDRLTHHYTASMSTVEAAHAQNERMLNEFAEFYKRSINSPSGAYKSYVIRTRSNLDEVRALTQWLDRQQIVWGRAGNSKGYKGFDYASGKEGRFNVEDDDVIISAYQPKGNLVKILFEPKTTLVDSVTYDITAWALPYVYGLEAYATSSKISHGEARLPETTPASGSGRPYAYIAEWKSLQDVKLVAHLLKEGVKMRFSMVPFQVEGKSFSSGSVVITRNGNENMGDRFDALVKEAAAEFQQTVYPVSTGFVDSGSDIGSSNVPYMKAPKIAVLSGEGTSPYNVGEVWHYFDNNIGYPISMINVDDFSYAPLENYDVVIFPEGRYGSLFTESFEKEFLTWVRSGGRVIALGSAIRSLERVKGLSSIKAKTEESESGELKVETLQPYGKQYRNRISESVVGAIFKVTLDDTHPLSFGLGDYFTLRDGYSQYELLEDGWNAGALAPDSHKAGFVGAKVKKQTENSLVFGEEQLGRGRVIYLTDNPVFRGFWHRGKLLFSNAIFLTQD